MIATHAQLVFLVRRAMSLSGFWEKLKVFKDIDRVAGELVDRGGPTAVFDIDGPKGRHSVLAHKCNGPEVRWDICRGETGIAMSVSASEMVGFLRGEL